MSPINQTAEIKLETYGALASMGEMRNAYKTSIGETSWRRTSCGLRIRSDDNGKMNLGEIIY
jgi:hypothetical protein